MPNIGFKREFSIKTLLLFLYSITVLVFEFMNNLPIMGNVAIIRYSGCLIAFVVFVSGLINFEKVINRATIYILLVILILSNLSESFIAPDSFTRNIIYTSFIILIEGVFPGKFNYSAVISAIGAGIIFTAIHFLKGSGETLDIIPVVVSGFISFIGVLSSLTIQKSEDSVPVLKDKDKKNLPTNIYEDMFENSADGIFQIRKDYSFQLVNYSLAKVFGFDSVEEAYKSKGISEFFKEKEEFEQLIKLLKTQGKVKNFRAVISKNEGQEIIVRLNARLVGNVEGDYFIEGNLQDITHLVRKEMESIKALKKLRDEKSKVSDEIDKVKKDSDFKTQFLANMSHEIRTPINSVMGFLTLIENGLYESEEEVKQFASDARLSAEALLDIINNILDISKIEAGKMEIEKIEFNLKEEIERVLSMLSPAAREKNIELLIETKRDVPELLIGDGTRYRQILVNLVSNAVKFTDKGFVKIEIDLDQTNKLRTKVRDTGIGIQPEKLELLFKPYEQIKGATVEKNKGTGLGLAISKEFVKLMGGEITVTSDPGKGSVFTFTVNFTHSGIDTSQFEINLNTREEIEAGLLEEIKESTETAFNSSARFTPSLRNKKRLLLVEDNPISQKVELRILREIGYAIDPVSNGFDAIEAIKSGSFDLVLMDVEMAEMDGITATKKIRELDGEISKIPIIAVTANSSMKDREKCLAAGMDDYVAKPININFLKMIIDRWLNEER